jgi:hypothetical protein
MTIDLARMEAVVRLAQQYGPFLFAVLFIFVVTRTAHKYYKECNTRAAPPASEDEKRAYRFYFIVSIWSGITVTALSVIWWIYAQIAGTNIYQVAIVGLSPDESVLSQYYVKSVPRPTLPGMPLVHDDYFIIAQSEPFKIGDKFYFDYFKISHNAAAPAVAVGIPSGNHIEIKYSGNKIDTFQISTDGGSVNLKILASNPAAMDNRLAADADKSRDRQLASIEKSDQ